VLQKGLPGIAEQTGKLRPGIRGAHIHNPHCLDSGFWWFDTKEARGLAALDAAPELSLCCNNQIELKALMPEDAKEAIGHGVRAKRSKSGAVSFDLLEAEARHAAVQ
jgi:hypothetical protein